MEGWALDMDLVSPDADHGPPGPETVETAVALEGDPASIARARHTAADFLARVRDGAGAPVSARARELTQLVVSELVTNVVKYAPGPVLLGVRIAGDTVEITVWDSDPQLPVARPLDPGRIGQHGLEIVLAVAQDVEVRRERVGKRVIVRLALLDEDEDDTALSGRPPQRR
ncbi:ATP-binding protein [Streptomyces sp. NPDC058466]|uniref:ATP-binding protein n=2 Tax=unclassified Streptomyces TaxID=2593676 RepID=UPI00365910F4